MQSPSYSPNESNDTDEQSDYANYDPLASIPSASLIQPGQRQHMTKSTAKEAHSTPQASHERSVHKPHTPDHGIPSLDRSMSPALRRQYLSSIIAACTPEELLFVSETVAPLLKRDFLYQLPVELAFHILSFIDDPQTLVRASQVCKYWYRVVRDDSVWRRMCVIYGFDGCEEAERQFQRVEKRRREERAKRKEVVRKLHSDEDHEQENKENEQENEERRKKHSNHPVEYSFRRHFKNSYIIRTNWRKGGKLLKAHHLPIVSPDAGTVTSLSLDSDWVVVGFSNSMIKIFSANKGVLCKTLVGHKSGVWSVCLVSEGGYRAPDPVPPPTALTTGASSSTAGAAAGRVSASAITGEFVEVSLPPLSRRPEPPRRRASVAQESSSSTQGTRSTPKSEKKKSSSKEQTLPDELSKLSLQDGKDVGLVKPPKRKSLRPKPLRMEPYGIPPAMQKVLGIKPHYSEEEDSGAQSSSNSAAEAPHSSATHASKSKGAQNQERAWRRYNERKMAEEMVHAEDQEEFRDMDASGTVTRSGSSRGWGQPNAIIVSGGCDKTVRVWDVVSGQCIYILDGHRSTIRTMRVLHNRPIAVSGSRDGTLRVWDIQLGHCLRMLEGHEQSVRCLDVHGNKVVSGSYDTTCRLWDIDTGQCIHVLVGHLHQVYSIAFDGVRIASGGLDTTVRIWDAETGQCVALLQGHTSLVCEIHLTPSILATGGSDGRVIAFSLATYKVLYRLTPHGSSITSLQLDEQYLVTGGSDGHVKLYETQTGKFVRELSEASDNVWKVAFGPETCAVMCRRGNRTVVEIWGLGPHAHRRTMAKARFMHSRKQGQIDGASESNNLIEQSGSVSYN